MELHVRRDEGGGEFCVGSRSCTTATDVIRDVVDLKSAYMRLNTRLRTPNDSPYLLTVLVGNDGTLCCTGIRTQNNPVLEQASNDCCSSAGGLREWDTALGQEGVPERNLVSES